MHANPEMLVRVWRGSVIESLHRVYMAAVNVRGETLHAFGRADYLTFARSTAKPLQAIPVVESGAFERFGFTDEQLALFSASHGGEPEHVAAAADALGRIGLTGDALQCGAHKPYHEPTAARMRDAGEAPTALHNNCSGKHSAMLALAVHLGVPIDGYLSPEHPVQRLMLQTVSEMSGVPAGDIPLGIDGCGVPVFGLRLQDLALAYARLGKPDELEPGRAAACRRIVSAIAEHPFYLAGSDRFDTALIQATNGRILGKMGAEGVYTMTVPDRGIGIALKIEDGAMRALNPAAIDTLVYLGLLEADELRELERYRRPQLRNHQETEVGFLEAVVIR